MNKASMSRKVKISTKFIVTLSSLISICLVIFISITANHFVTRMSENNNELYKAYNVSETLKLFKSNNNMLDLSLERYMLTGDARNLEQYKQKETETKTQLKSIEKYFEGLDSEKLVERLRELTYKKLVEAKDLRSGNNLNSLQAQDNREESRPKTNDEINSVVDELNSFLSQTSRELINNSTSYLAVSKKWNIFEIELGIIVALAGVILLFRDINLRNQLEQELRNAKKQAEENALMKEQFMANVSHEIRTPMNAIVGFSGLLQKTKLDTTQAEYLSAISNSGSNLLNIINDILDFSKIEAGKLQIEKIAFALHQQLQSLQLMFGEKAKEKNIGFQINISNEVPKFIFGDPTRLNQILVNLLGNAIKFTNKGQVVLSCELKSLEHDVAQLVFKVKDTGVGIPADKLKEVFERFNQGNKETTRIYGGTGLGLAIVKSLVEIQNGTIQVKSKEGVGSEFSIIMSYPVSYETVNGESKPETRRLGFTGNRIYRVLLVDDNGLNQKLATAYLQGFGLYVETADNGEAALDMLKNNHYDLVLMDIQMPIMDGYQATLEIRQRLKLQVPIIAVTARVISGEREKCLQLGMNGYITKPFKETELFDTIRELLNATELQAAKPLPTYDLSRTIKLNVVDLKELSELARGNKQFMCEMIEIFLEQNPGDISDIENGIKNNDFGLIRAVAHRMKTSVGFMGLQTLIEPLNQMELFAEKNSNMQQIINLFSGIQLTSQQALEELKNVLHTLKTEVL